MFPFQSSGRAASIDRLNVTPVGGCLASHHLTICPGMAHSTAAGMFAEQAAGT